VGIGIKGLDQLTFEAHDLLRKCRVIYAFTGQQKIFSKKYRNVIDMEDAYWKADSFQKIYKKIVRTVVKDALDGGRVAIVTYGHPLVFDSVSLNIIKQARKKGISTQVIPGISCLDTMVVDLEIDFGNGMQIFDAEDVVVSNIAINPEIDLLLMQVGALGIEAPNRLDFSTKNRLRPLARYLKKKYKRNRQAIILFSDDGNGLPVKIKTTVAKIEEYEEEVVSGTTLYIPGSHLN